MHDRVVFVGDSAHQVSPFGARGGNGGVQDADNLGWKLAAVIQGRAPAGLVRTYDDERIPAADENILHSTRATDFITPKTEAARAYRDAALALAGPHAFARGLVNSGRLSRPHRMALRTPDSDTWPGCLPPGSAAVDAPLDDGDWLLRQCLGFTLLMFDQPAWPGPSGNDEDFRTVHIPAGSLAAARYGAPPGACVLLRPDQHVLALFRRFDPARVRGAVHRALMGQPALEAVA